MNRPLLRLLAALVTGVLFGVGLAIAQMTNPDKVLNFLDVLGTWDASLLFVLGAATGSFTLAFFLLRNSKTPLLDAVYHRPEGSRIDRHLVLGAALFGIGWGLAGYCPGPAIASLGFGNLEALWVVPAMVAGIALHRLLSRAGA